jgi:dTDP-4-dehydrorhamnose reductase
MSSWLVTGGAGMLAHDLGLVLPAAGHRVTLASHSDLDVTDPSACAAAVAGHDVVVNAAAWTAVDDAESHEPEAFAVNAQGAANVARAARSAGVPMVQVSTDYVFPGDAHAPYAVDAPTGPRSAYGRTKLSGEWAVRALCPESWVVRTAWLYGAGGSSFVRTMSRLAAERDTVQVVADQEGQPTWTRDLADLVVRLVDAGAPFGTYHGTSSGSTTWHGLAAEVFAGLGLDPARVRPTTTDAFPRPAERPAYSVLAHNSLVAAGIHPIRDWRPALHEALPVVTASGTGQ